MQNAGVAGIPQVPTCFLENQSWHSVESGIRYHFSGKSSALVSHLLLSVQFLVTSSSTSKHTLVVDSQICEEKCLQVAYLGQCTEKCR